MLINRILLYFILLNINRVMLQWKIIGVNDRLKWIGGGGEGMRRAVILQ